jgi:hypothetical protein
LQLPDINGSVHSSMSEFPTSMKSGTMTATEKRVNDVTKNLITMYRTKRIQVFHSMAKTKTAMRSKEFFKIYLNPSETIMKRKKPVLFKNKFHKPKPKPFCYQMEYERLRGLRESEEELAKVQAYIDKMIQKNIKKYEEEKRKRQMAEKAVDQTSQKLLKIAYCRTVFVLYQTFIFS